MHYEAPLIIIIVLLSFADILDGMLLFTITMQTSASEGCEQETS